MKKIIAIFFALTSCSNVQSNEKYYCLASDNKSILLVSSHYPEIDSIKYYPYLKNIKISKPIKEKSIDMGDNAKPEIYRTMNEMINGKITGKYTFMSQGYLLYNVEYFSLKTKKKTFFEKNDLRIKGINCI
ncbi:hypothetical protein EGK58_000990 [Acinetobacter variabilis]|uniref:hypothetical protein n=1 Tax=Acinetobacter variabilis TaxID=70346 RepID=UPI000F65F561|nr:hypothetical protein [Acinetobacter variabilis]QXR19556.1 hypothetical protein EGK58_000990 [Acinetobacter variabilis]